MIAKATLLCAPNVGHPPPVFVTALGPPKDARYYTEGFAGLKADFTRRNSTAPRLP